MKLPRCLRPVGWIPEKMRNGRRDVYAAAAAGQLNHAAGGPPVRPRCSPVPLAAVDCRRSSRQIVAATSCQHDQHAGRRGDNDLSRATCGGEPRRTSIRSTRASQRSRRAAGRRRTDHATQFVVTTRSSRVLDPSSDRGAPAGCRGRQNVRLIAPSSWGYVKPTLSDAATSSDHRPMPGSRVRTWIPSARPRPSRLTTPRSARAMAR